MRKFVASYVYLEKKIKTNLLRSRKMAKDKIKIYPDTKFMTMARLIITVIMLIFMGILTMSSMLGTVGIQKVEEYEELDTILYRILPGWETVIYYSDGIIGNILWLAAGMVIIFLILPLLKKIPLWAELTVVSAWTITLGAIWVYSSNSAPSEDSWWVTKAACQFAENNFDCFSGDNRYFYNYSYQLGYVFFNEIFIRIAMIFGEPENLLFLEMINVILLAAAYIAVILINTRIFKDERIRHVTALLLMFASQPIIFCSFLYGIIPGMTFALYGVLFMILYMQKDKFIYGIFSAVCTALAVMIKTNNNIVLVAICSISFVIMFKRKKFIKDVLYIALTAALSLSVSPAVKAFYESRSDVDLGDPIPYSAWFLMGLNEAENGPGWYNPEYTVHLYTYNNYNADEASKSAVEQIKNRVEYFADDPQYRHDFFYKKFISQWNETSYQSIWNNTIRNNYEPREGVAEWVCADGEKDVKRYMDIYAQLIFAAVFIGLLACLKNKNILSVMMPLIILGGMLYHLLAEAKSQYSMPYFIMMIGFSAYGIVTAYNFFEKKSQGRKLVGLIFYPNLINAAKEKAVPIAEESAENICEVPLQTADEAAEEINPAERSE